MLLYDLPITFAENQNHLTSSPMHKGAMQIGKF